MKKINKMKAALVLLPLMMVFVASNPSGVMVFDGVTVSYVSWFQTVPESPYGWCAPVAGLVNYVLFGMAILCAVTKKKWCLQGVFGLALGAACIAVLPIIAQPEIKIVPNVMGAILLAAESAIAYMGLKKQEETPEKKYKGKRLKNR